MILGSSQTIVNRGNFLIVAGKRKNNNKAIIFGVDIVNTPNTAYDTWFFKSIGDTGSSFASVAIDSTDQYLLTMGNLKNLTTSTMDNFFIIFKLNTLDIKVQKSYS